jgi:uncharacterized protein (TIGR02270 family)
MLAEMTRHSLPEIVSQHVEESASLAQIRLRLLSAAHVRLRDLGRLDARLAAHLDGVALAGELGSQLAARSLEFAGRGDAFVATVRAVEDGRVQWLLALCRLGASIPAVRRGVCAALGWMSPPYLKGTIRDLLVSADPIYRQIGITACALHRVDPGLLSARHAEDRDDALRARALRACGELGNPAFASTCVASVEDDEPECQFWAAWSAVLLGNRNRALEALVRVALARGPRAHMALQMALLATDSASADQLLRRIVEPASEPRLLIGGCGFVGDPIYAPWLIDNMTSVQTARLAGESFCLITGADLKSLQLAAEGPVGLEFGPSDNPDDPNADMDEDDGLPWPDVVKIQSWWHANASRFQYGTRYFMGQPLNRENCLRVLKEGFQRQRIAAALHLSVLNPGAPLFEWRAPAWRQQRLLAEMS